MRSYCRIFLLTACLAAAAACSPKSRETRVSESGGLRPESAHSASSLPATDSDRGLTFTAPPGWISETPASSNRKAQYRLPRAQGDAEDGEVAVYYFRGGGGNAQANVDRWIGQFTGPGGNSVEDAAKTMHSSVDGIPLTIVDVSGTYAGSMMMPMQQSGSTKDHFRMLAAIAEAGNGPWFIKLTGPERTVARWESSFQSFLKSIKQAKQSS
jgi:hypothetical protein